jgi:hypothetical protein
LLPNIRPRVQLEKERKREASWYEKELTRVGIERDKIWCVRLSILEHCAEPVLCGAVASHSGFGSQSPIGLRFKSARSTRVAPSSYPD